MLRYWRLVFAGIFILAWLCFVPDLLNRYGYMLNFDYLYAHGDPYGIIPLGFGCSVIMLVGIGFLANSARK